VIVFTLDRVMKWAERRSHIPGLDAEGKHA